MASDDATIEVRVGTVSQLFDTLDPLPFRERDLDKDAEEFIVGWARELPRSSPIRIVIHLPTAEAQSAAGQELKNAFSRYFEYRAENTARELKVLFRIGRLSLAIGLFVLAFCIAASTIVGRFIGNGDVRRFLEEGFVILGWVANWKPVEIFLYDWWPIRGRKTLYLRLANASVELAPENRDLDPRQTFDGVNPSLS